MVGIPKQATLLLLLLALASVSAHPFCINGELPVMPDPLLDFCPSFNIYPGACCTKQQERVIVLKTQQQIMPVVTLTARDQTCYALVRTVLCASCSPLSGHSFGVETDNPKPYPMLCAPFCSRFYEACAKFPFSAPTNRTHGFSAVIPGTPNRPNTIFRIQDMYPTEQEYCQEFGSRNPGYCVTDKPEEPLFGAVEEKDTIKLSLAFPPSRFQGLLPPGTVAHLMDLRFKPGKTTPFACAAFQSGQIIAFDPKQVDTAWLFLDIAQRMYFQEPSEMGLLGIEFDPNFDSNGYFYVKYTAGDSPTNGTVRLSRFRLAAGEPKRLDPNSERIVLDTHREAIIHHGGAPVFGNGGRLFVPIGDSLEYGLTKPGVHPSKDLNDLKGKILCLNMTESSMHDNDWNGPIYTIPDDNPLVGRDGARPETFAWGLRNVWRLSWDPVRQELWGADVGGSKFEEVNLISKGTDLGWNQTEGFFCNDRNQYCDPETDRFLRPVFAHPNFPVCNSQECFNIAMKSIIGGFWYRGVAVPSFSKRYIYGDYDTKAIYALEVPDRDNPHVGAKTNRLKFVFPDDAQHAQIPGRQDMRPAAFAEDPDGELYVLNWMYGEIFKLSQPTP